jgi:hypothetical protein
MHLPPLAFGVVKKAAKPTTSKEQIFFFLEQKEMGEINHSSSLYGTRANIPSTLLISPAPKPVKVRLCFGLEIPAGPTEP